MSTLFKHQAAKNCCSGSEQDINTIGMSRQQTNISALDTEALSMEPGKVFKNSYLHWNVGRMIPASTWSQEVQNGPFTKKNQLQWCHSRAAQSLTGRVKAHLGNAIWFLTVHIQSAGAVPANEEKPSTAQQAVASNTMSPAVQQDNDSSWTQVKQRQATSC